MTPPLADVQLDELARLEAGATLGEWYAFLHAGWRGDDGVVAADVSANEADGTFVLASVTSGSAEQCDRDRNFIIAARNAMPALLAELRLLRALADAMERHTIYPNAWPRMVGPAFMAWREWKAGAK